jgi:Uma2 family endonuclease
MAVEPKLMTADELLRLPRARDGLRRELVRGELRTMAPPGFEHGEVTGDFRFSLGQHVRVHRLGRVVGAVGFQLTTDPDTVRAPDVAFLRQERLPDSPVRGYWPGAPDLV